jgi:predicted HTH transcriptional regulator
MGATKLEYYSPEELRNSELGRAVGAPARIIILRFIEENNRVTGPELKKILKLGKPTIQQHIESLVLSGLIWGKYYGNRYGWELNPNNSEDFEKIKWALKRPD